MHILETNDISSLNLAGGISPLHFCAWQGKVGVLKVCLDKGLQPNLRDDSNRTALHMAAWSGNPDAAQLLLDRNASIDLLNNDGATPAMEAARIGNPGTLDLLLASGADVNASDARGNGLVEYAASGGHKALVTILKRRGAPPRNTLHVAAGIGDLAALRAQFPDNNSTDANTSTDGAPHRFYMQHRADNRMPSITFSKKEPTPESRMNSASLSFMPRPCPGTAGF